MADDPIRVALIAADGDSAELLRGVLDGLDCMTVYDAPAGDFEPITLASSGANVVIVDLTPDAEIDRIYDLLDDQRYRVIFNEAAVTSRLTGWEHARWARHLAAKILSLPQVVDPPRPSATASVVVSTLAVGESFKPKTREPFKIYVERDDADAGAAELGIDDWLSEVMQTKDPSSSFVLAEAGIDANALERSTDILSDVPSEDQAEKISPKAARDSELDGLMASAVETLGREGASSDPLKPAADERFDWRIEDVIRDIDEWLPPSVPESELRSLAAGNNPRLWSPVKTTPDNTCAADNDDDPLQSSEPAATEMDLQLEPLSENARWEAPATSAIPPSVSKTINPSPPFAANPPGKTDRVAAIAGSASSASQPLELAPLDDVEASPRFAARALGNDQEMRIDVVSETDAPTRLVVLCASVGGPEAIRELLGALPSNFPSLFLVVQQVGEEFLDLLSQQLRRATKLRVRGAERGQQLCDGDVVPVSPRQRLLVDRSGRVAGTERLEEGSAAPINQLLRNVSDNFGADCTVIVLSGIASDLADGCRYLAGRGGRVYAQAASSCVASAMVEQVQQAGVVSFQGTPAELASRLMADHS